MPVITLDGPAALGKGIIAEILARELRWNILDRGVFYRSLAYIAQQRGISLQAVDALVALALSPPFLLCREAPWLTPAVFLRELIFLRLFVQSRQLHLPQK